MNLLFIQSFNYIRNNKEVEEVKKKEEKPKRKDCPF